MGMSVGPGEGEDSAMSEINVVPLTDVMLVLLIIFLITIPVVLQTVPVELPKVRFEPTQTKPENVNLSVRGTQGSCEVYWGLQRVNSQELLDKAVEKLKAEIERQGGPANVTELPEAHIRGDINTHYACVGGAVFTMQRAGFSRVGFISEPAPGGTTTRL